MSPKSSDKPHSVGTPLQAFVKWLQDALAEQKSLHETLGQFPDFLQSIPGAIQSADQLDFIKQAAEQFEQAFDIASEGEDAIRLEMWKGHRYETVGGWELAVKAFRQVIVLARLPEDAHFRAEAYLWIGHVQLMQSHRKKALNAYHKSREIAQKYHDDNAEANACNGLAYYYFEEGDFPKAGELWEQGLETATRLSDLRLMAKLNNNLGALANVRGEWQRALARYTEGLLYFGQMADIRGEAETYHNMAMTYADARRWSDAGLCYRRSLALARELGDVRLQAMVKMNRVDLYLQIGDPDIALSLCRQAMDIFKQLDDQLGVADACKMLGRIAALQEQWTGAEEHFNTSLKLTQKLNSPLSHAETQLELGRMLAKKGDIEEARQAFEAAKEQFEALGAENDLQLVIQGLASLNDPGIR